MGKPEQLTKEQDKLGSKIRKRTRIVDLVWARLGLVRLLLAVVGLAWIAALPHPALWKNVFVDEHALQPAQVTMYFNWDNVAAADRYLNELEKLRDSGTGWPTFSSYIQRSFMAAGVPAAKTGHSVYAHISPPRSEGTEAILISANRRSLTGEDNLRGVAMLLSLADFLKGQNHWAYDFYLVVGDGYVSGLQDFLSSYNPRANIWTALNLDYPGHSFSHLGLFYEGVNGRLPNQDVLNSIATIARWSGGVDPSLHDLPARPPRDYATGFKHLLKHFSYAGLGRPSAAHGLLSAHRIDAVTLFANPAEGPHGFYTLGRTVESSLRSLNNLLERLHASFFFYLLPHPDAFLPVGHYLPAAVLLGASVTLGGFDCPDPLGGAMWLLRPILVAIASWYAESPQLAAAAVLLPRPEGAEAQSMRALAHLLYGALIPTLAMVNFPQAIALALLVLVAFLPVPRVFKPLVVAVLSAPTLLALVGINLQAEWEAFGNLAWPALFAVWIPLVTVTIMT